MGTWLRDRWRGALVAAIAVIMTAGLVTGGVLAQTPPPGAGQPPAPLISATDFFARLAAKLGLDAGRVQTAAKDAQKELIDEAAQAGRRPAAAAARLKERVDAGDFVLGHGPGGKPGRGGFGRGVGIDQPALASWLGITPEQLHSELHEGAGQSLAQVAQAHGKTREALIAFLTDRVKTRLDQAVADGRLTRQQADEMLARFQQNVGRLVDQVHPAGVPDGQRGPGHPRSPQGTPIPRTGSA
jgi:hypothetical protein